MASTKKIIGVSGSLRTKSCNTGLLRYYKQVLAEKGVELEIVEIGDLPLYNADLDPSPTNGLSFPATVQRWRKSVEEADAFVIAVPEHNFSVPAALKNAIDWASRTAPGA